jgi:hypothetical protein
VFAGTEGEAAAQLVTFVDEMSTAALPDTRDVRDSTVDEAIERFLTEHLDEEKGRAEKTINDYRKLHYQHGRTKRDLVTL